MAKKAKKSAVKKTSSKTKSAARGTKTSLSKSKAKKTTGKTAPVKKPLAARANKLSTGLSTNLGGGSQRVSEYKLFTEDSVRGLEDQVNYFIKKGWSPVGGVVLQGSNFTQTMVRHED